jgi:iron(III) transport system ATP-binding protein
MPLKCQISNLSKRYGGRTAVDDVSLEVESGEFIVLLGPSGCGKTTTLRLIAGLAAPDSGSIAIDGRTVSAPAENVFVRPEHRDIGMVFQSYAIWPHMTVLENVAYPLRVRRLRGAALREKVENVLGLVGLAGEAARPATALSGGQMQRVALARALVFDPTLLLFDEPLSNLDLKLRERLRAELKALQRRTGITSIYVTHDQAEAVELADRIAVMDGGRVVQHGRAREIYQRPHNRFVADFISTANVFEAVVDALVGAGTARVRSASGRAFVARHEHPVAVGDRVDIVVHPEDCAISLDAPEGHRVTITAARFQGTSTRYTVDWAGAPFDVVALGSATLHDPGLDVMLTLPPDRVRIVAHRP